MPLQPDETLEQFEARLKAEHDARRDLAVTLRALNPPERDRFMRFLQAKGMDALTGQLQPPRSTTRLNFDDPAVRAAFEREHGITRY